MFELLPVLFASAVFTGVILAINLAFWAARSAKMERAALVGRRLGALVPEGDLLRPTRQAAPAWTGALGRAAEGLIARAGLDEAPRAFLLRSALFAVLGALCMCLLTRSPAGLAGALLGLVPSLFAHRAADQRSTLITAALPEGLDLIVRTLRAGHAFSDALRISAVELPQPLAGELSVVAEHHRLGQDLRQCLLDLADRNASSFDMRLFVSAVLLQRETGGNLVEMLDNLGQTIRDRLVFQDKVRALTAEVRLSAAVLTGMPFLVAGVIFFVQPDYLRPLIETPLGRGLLLAGGCALVAGAWMMRLVSRVEA